MKPLMTVCLFLLTLPALAQAPYDVLTYQPGTIIPAGDVSMVPKPLEPPHDGWYALTLTIPPESTGIEASFNTLTWTQGVTVEFFLYAYDFQGAFLQSAGKTTTAIPTRHASPLSLSWGGNNRPTTVQGLRNGRKK